MLQIDPKYILWKTCKCISFKNSDLCYESAQGQNSSMIGNRWYPRKVRLWTWNSKQEIRPSLADCFPNHSQNFILVIFMNTPNYFHLSRSSTKHQIILNIYVLCLNNMFIICENKKTNVPNLWLGKIIRLKATQIHIFSILL